jgi:hypothetical protein
MTQGEEQTIRNVIARLRCEVRPNGSHGESDEVREALTGYHARIYLDTWGTLLRRERL